MKIYVRLVVEVVKVVGYDLLIIKKDEVVEEIKLVVEEIKLVIKKVFKK